MLHINHNTQPLPIDKAHEAAAPARQQSDLARKLVVSREQFAALSAIGDSQQATMQNVEARPAAQASEAATKQPWVSPGSYLPAGCDSFRVH
ncbi:MAG: hypothetical protein JSR63_12375 [Proteobacteria bacterium]|nr:hypothetical protein [Pseudomonadota bacterium]MBS0218955.1 hypothetical protein [Pseudomonadota bacterium]